MIDSFKYEYAFLSNFYEAPLVFENIPYRNSEAAFQAQKTLDIEIRKQFSNLDASNAKKLGRSVNLRTDWNAIKNMVMYRVCNAKFTQNPELKEKLMNTNNEYLVEGNNWNDTYWGKCNNYGLNKLGEILMTLRSEYILDKKSTFNAKLTKDNVVKWIRDTFDDNGQGCKAVIGISGGKDSSVCAALCVEALGRENVVGVLMPNGNQSDIEDSIELVEHLGIDFTQVNIGESYNDILHNIDNMYIQKYDKSRFGKQIEVSDQTRINLAPRLRMATLYAIAQSVNGRVINTCNLSEDWIGYSTRYGDSVGDFSPLAKLTSDEVITIGAELGLPEELIYKTPSDGVCGKSDEDNFGFTYRELNYYIRYGYCGDLITKNKIDSMNQKNKFKLLPMPFFDYQPAMR